MPGQKGWDKPHRGKEEKESLALLKDLIQLRKIKFSRSIEPLEMQLKARFLVVFGHGLGEACCPLCSLVIQ
jgi:hypothetical protein